MRARLLAMSSLVIATVNVNGLRAAARKGFVEWLAGTKADVVCLQETRAELDQLPPEVAEPDGWHVVLVPAATKGRAGVAVYSRMKPDAVRIGFGSAEFADSGRYVEADFGPVSVASLYLPSGQVGTRGCRRRKSGSWRNPCPIWCVGAPKWRPRGGSLRCAATGISRTRRLT